MTNACSAPTADTQPAHTEWSWCQICPMWPDGQRSWGHITVQPGPGAQRTWGAKKRGTSVGRATVCSGHRQGSSVASNPGWGTAGSLLKEPRWERERNCFANSLNKASPAPLGPQTPWEYDENYGPYSQKNELTLIK